MKLPFRGDSLTLEIHLCAENDRVFRLAGTFGISVEYGSLVVERVFQVSGQYPIQADCPGFHLAAGAGPGPVGQCGGRGASFVGSLQRSIGSFVRVHTGVPPPTP